jgi:hypothetical protein
MWMLSLHGYFAKALLLINGMAEVPNRNTSPNGAHHLDVKRSMMHKHRKNDRSMHLPTGVAWIAASR